LSISLILNQEIDKDLRRLRLAHSLKQSDVKVGLTLELHIEDMVFYYLTTHKSTVHTQTVLTKTR